MPWAFLLRRAGHAYCMVLPDKTDFQIGEQGMLIAWFFQIRQISR
jgi:hypothetical protein